MSKFNVSKEVFESLIKEGLSGREMSKRLGMSQTHIRYNLRKLELNTRRSKAIPKSSVCEICGCKVSKNRNRCQSCYTRKKIPTSKLKNPASRLRKILLETRGHKCQNCGISLWQDYPITLELHHKDGNSKNNDESNLQLLCPNCHSQSWDYRFTMNKVSPRRDERYGKERTIDGREV